MAVGPNSRWPGIVNRGAGLIGAPGGSTFDPLSLFANGEQGVWYDPSDPTTLFQDHFGSIPAAYGQPVGLMLDKSRWSLRGANVVPDLATNNLVNTENWSYDTASRRLILNPVNGLRQVASLGQFVGTSQIGDIYEVSYDLVSISGGGITVGGSRLEGPPAYTTPGKKTHLMRVRVGGGGSFEIIPSTPTTAAVIENLSVRQVIGNHESQPTVPARPSAVDRGGKLWVKGDGLDDILLTNPIDMSHTDKITVWALVERSNSGRVLAELGQGAGTSGSFYISTENTYRLSIGGLGYRQRLVSEAPLPSDVLVAHLDRADLISPLVRLNRVEIIGSMNIGSPITGNYGGAYPLALFARWTGAVANMHNSAAIRSFGMIDRLLTPDEITQLEAYLEGLK